MSSFSKMGTQSKILDIAMNLNRVGNWAADDYHTKKERIKMFLENTSKYIQEVNEIPQDSRFRKTYDAFIDQYLELEKEGLQRPKNPLWWAEEMMTWGNILTHRAKLI